MPQKISHYIVVAKSLSSWLHFTGSTNSYTMSSKVLKDQDVRTEEIILIFVCDCKCCHTPNIHVRNCQWCRFGWGNVQWWESTTSTTLTSGNLLLVKKTANSRLADGTRIHSPIDAAQGTWLNWMRHTFHCLVRRLTDVDWSTGVWKAVWRL